MHERKLQQIEQRRLARIARHAAAKAKPDPFKTEAYRLKRKACRLKRKAEYARFWALTPEQRAIEFEAHNAKVLEQLAKKATKDAARQARIDADVEAFKNLYGFDPYNPPASEIGKYYPWPKTT